MIVVDSSALIAILLHEPEEIIFENLLSRTPNCIMSAMNVFEAATVMRRRSGEEVLRKYWGLIIKMDIRIVSFDAIQMRAALETYSKYGKGIHSKASLNLCDCAAYALAITNNAPLLYKGDDFTATDVKSCL